MPGDGLRELSNFVVDPAVRGVTSTVDPQAAARGQPGRMLDTRSWRPRGCSAPTGLPLRAVPGLPADVGLALGRQPERERRYPSRSAWGRRWHVGLAARAASSRSRSSRRAQAAPIAADAPRRSTPRGRSGGVRRSMSPSGSPRSGRPRATRSRRHRGIAGCEHGLTSPDARCPRQAFGSTPDRRRSESPSDDAPSIARSGRWPGARQARRLPGWLDRAADGPRVYAHARHGAYGCSRDARPTAPGERRSSTWTAVTVGTPTESGAARQAAAAGVRAVHRPADVCVGST